MRDYILPTADIEAEARRIDPKAWCSSDSMAGAFGLRYRRYMARELAGWPNEHWPRNLKADGEK